MKDYLRRIQTYWKLGAFNILHVVFYRCKVRLGYFRNILPISSFGYEDEAKILLNPSQCQQLKEKHNVSFFSATSFEVESPPDWLLNPYSKCGFAGNDVHWSDLPDFSLPTGDIKIIWELSRFDWLIKAAWATRRTGITTLPFNLWLNDWCQRNPPNRGVNWKCAQEVSIRMLNVILAQLILSGPKNHSFTSEFNVFLSFHVSRILPTISYAKAQNNNHGTTEACALFVAGLVLGKSKEARHIKLGALAEKLGRRLLSERVDKLIDDDGVFSQYSVNYHRMMLDTLSFSELIRIYFGAVSFDAVFYRNGCKAARWLLAVTDPVSGDAPNIGANDGSLLFNCENIDYRDFRPSLELASVVFLDSSNFPESPHCLLEIFETRIAKVNETYSLKDSSLVVSDRTTLEGSTEVYKGFKRIGDDLTFAILKTPISKFRPSQADALHVDLWHNGLNIIRDSGTYSYNAPDRGTEDLGDTRFHSTIEINGRDQMSKVSKFLYTGWLSEGVMNVECKLGGSDSMFREINGCYVDAWGASHSRTICLADGLFVITDKLRGTSGASVLRFRLAPLVWRLNNLTVQSDLVSLSVAGDGITDTSLVRSIESRYYMEHSDVMVFEVALEGDCVTTTRLEILAQ